MDPLARAKPAAQSPPLRGELAATATALMARRLRLAAWTALVSSLLFAWADAAGMPARIVPILGVKVAQVLGTVFVLALLRRPNGERHAHDLALVLAITLCASTAAGNALRDDRALTSVLLGFLCMGYATFFPWGAGRQAILAFTAVIAVAYSYLAGDRSSGGYEHAGALIAIVGSVYVAFDAQRYRQALETQNILLRRRGRELSLSEERFRRAFDDGPIGRALLALDGRFLRINRAFCEVVGYAEEEILKLDFQHITHPDDLQEDLGYVARVLAGQMSQYQMEKRYLRKDGTLVTVLLSVSLVRDESGVALYFLSQVQDITARKRAEAELHRAKEAAEAANQAKSEFLANMSHEIRTPMNGVMGMTEMVLATELSSEQRECLSMAHESARALLRVIDDILDFSVIEAGKLSLDTVELDVRELMAGAVRMFAIESQAKGIQIGWEVAEDVPSRLATDGGRLRQVLVNLLGNAVKFTDAGGVSVSVQLAEPPAAGAGVMLHFAVQDTGVGISREQQEHVFEAFRQADVSTRRRFGGTGLGLTISARLVGLLGGRVWVESEVGHGSTFHFTVPVEPRPAAPAEVAPSPRTPEGSRRSLRLLLAEDNTVNQRLAIRLLEKHGHQVVLARDGREALAAFGQQTFDAVLMDVQMPRMDGIEATAAIRALESARGSRTPIIAMTAHALKGDAERCLAAGMDAYISKPIDAKRLVATLDDLTAGAERQVA